MTSFDDRERGQEAKFSLDQQSLFRATMRRNKLLGMWAADLLGLAGDEAEAYAKTVVMSDLEEPGDDDVIRKVVADFDAKGVAKSREDIAKQLAALMPIAVEQISAEG
ncbi:MAG: aldolase [Ponticaulis sp.]|nr:aldolase [Ponticaulis sp.]